MTHNEKEELVQHWMLLAKTIFAAENNISEKWTPILQSARGKTDFEVQQTCDAYLRAIATEIIEKGYEE